MLKFRKCLILKLASDNDRFMSQCCWRLKIKGDICKWRLETDPRRYVDIEDELLQSLFDFIVAEVVMPDKRRKICVKVRKGLSTGSLSLQGVKKVSNLS